MGNYHVVKSTKSVGLGILLTLLFGPVGLFYSTVFGGIVMTFGPFLLVIIFLYGMGIQNELISIIAGGAIIIGWAFWWLICMIWSAIAINQYNKRLMSRSVYNTSYYPVNPTTESPSYLESQTKQLAYQKTNLLSGESSNKDIPTIQDWLKANPNKGVNDYYIKFKK